MTTPFITRSSIRNAAGAGTAVLFISRPHRCRSGLILLLIALTSSLGCAKPAPSDPIPGFPKLVLWAWERPEYLEFIDPKTTGIAYWAGTIFLIGDEASFHPRMQSLKVPESTAMIAVVRIDNAHGGRLSLSSAQRSAAVAQLAAIASRPDLRGLQIDFDATVSERPFYRQLLVDLRRLLPPGLPLSITALASWCLGDPWIRDLPIDEAVPMLFSMGRDDALIRERLSRRSDFTTPACRTSLGLSVDEAQFQTPPGRRRYYFSRQRWNPDAPLVVTGTREKPVTAGPVKIAVVHSSGNDLSNLEERK